MAEKVKIYRHELKYLIHYEHYILLKERLKHILKTDQNAEQAYHVRSLYFDDMYHIAYKTKEDGLLERKKFRIRVYNYDAGLIKLEKKEKYGHLIAKEALRIDQELYEKILRADLKTIPIKEQGLLDEWVYQMKNQGLRPSVIVDYHREAFVMEPGQVRITFDQNLNVVDKRQDLFTKSKISKAVLAPNIMIMEIKYTQILPSLIKEVMQIGSLNKSAVSKYTLCIDKNKAGGLLYV